MPTRENRCGTARKTRAHPNRRACGNEFFHHKFPVMAVIVFWCCFPSDWFSMTSTDQALIERFINDAKAQRQWLYGELASLDTSSENYKSNQRAIHSALRELDKAISHTVQTCLEP